MISFDEPSAFGLFCLCLFVGCDKPPSATSVKPEAPVVLMLGPYFVFDGYYITVHNAGSRTLTNIALTYYRADGAPGSWQLVGHLNPGEGTLIDPADAGWKVEAGEKIAVQADDHFQKLFDTDALIAEVSNQESR